MKKQLIYLVFLLILPFSVLSQTDIDFGDVEIVEEEETFDPKKDVIPFIIVEQAPIFKNCKKMTGKELKKCFKEKLDEHISKTLVYPKEYIKDAIKTRVFVVFKIDRKGEVIDIRTRSMRKDKELFEKEAINVIKNIPKLKPAMHGGEKVTVNYTTVIEFSL